MLATASVANTCDMAAREAASRTRVPLDVLRAITRTETARNGKPWPWTINIAGRGIWLDDRSALLSIARDTLGAGEHSFDLGCFQVNYRWHGAQFASLEQMVDPVQNALYAARFLERLHDETGDWTLAAGRYHSRTEQHAARYRTLYSQHVSQLDEPAGRLNSFALLQGGAVRMGSLVPVDRTDARRLIPDGRGVSLFGQGS
ncbi:lytic transglycosylase domain-containing protein [Qingshengfaniella alkalisoli]|uniref:Lytic transglycosylase domain-containing protein n=2 Tax=Qingshengfaniella alkalisoli TaxID=2599296 RepID=A0A5B8IZH1_9RHOB|nr:lytic transglycosylase domain-containing protein [Qingshengfaniella alkalisoli]